MLLIKILAPDPEDIYRDNLARFIDVRLETGESKASIARACFPGLETAPAVRRLDRELGTAPGQVSEGVKWETLACLVGGLGLESVAALFAKA